MTERQRATSSAVEVDRPSRRLTGRELVSLRHSSHRRYVIRSGVRHDRLPRHLLGHGDRGPPAQQHAAPKEKAARVSRSSRAQPRAASALGPWESSQNSPQLWSAANGLANAISLLQLFSLREFDGSRTQSPKVPRAPPRKDCRRRATKSNATYVCRAHLALPSNKRA